MSSVLHRPEPILSHRAQLIHRAAASKDAAVLLCEGIELLVADDYRTGVEVLAQLEALLQPLVEDGRFSARQAFKRAYKEAAFCLLAPVAQHQVALKGAGEIGFLRELYPECTDFFLPFIQLQELYGAWQRYQKGIQLAVLGHRVHPFYGTYAPTRVSHLELFGTWLSQYQGAREKVLDVGTGCGVLTLMLSKSGCSHVMATDINPNAIESLSRELRRHSIRSKITLFCCDLLEEIEPELDLIVFNPPWIEGEVEELLDQALYFNSELFERFFDQAFERLSSSGRLVLVFSNVIQLLQPNVPHPILTELASGRFRLVQKLRRRVRPPKKKGERRTRERVEVWELAKER